DPRGSQRTAERHSSAAAAASVSYELPETNMAAAVCCSAWFGQATSPIRKRIPTPRLPTGKPQGQVNSLPSTEPRGLELRQQRDSLIHSPASEQLDDQNESDASLPE